MSLIEQHEARASAALQRLRDEREAAYARWRNDPEREGPYHSRVRPYVIEFFGTPKSGKTTMKSMLAHFFRREGWKVVAPEEGAEAVKWVRDEPWYNFQTTEYAMGLVRDLYYSDAELVIMDRATMDGVMRMELYHARGLLTSQEHVIAEGYYMLPWTRALFDAHVCLVAQPEVALRRELMQNVSQKQGQTMNHKSLTDLLEMHRRVWKRLDGDGDVKLSWHDSSAETPEQTFDAMFDHVLRSFERRDVTQNVLERSRLRY